MTTMNYRKFPLVLLILTFCLSTNSLAKDNNERQLEQSLSTIEEFKNSNSTLSFAQGKKVMAAYKRLSELQPDNFTYKKEYIYVLYTFPSQVGGNQEHAEQLLQKLALTLPFESHVLRFYLLVQTNQLDRARAELEIIEEFSDRADEITPLYELLENS